MIEMRTPRRIYTPKKDMKDIVLELIDIVNEMSWEQANRELSGQNYHIQTSRKLQKLVKEMKLWGTEV